MTLTKFMARSTWVAHAFEWEKLLKWHLKGKASKKLANGKNIDYSEKRKRPKGFICPCTGVKYHNIQTCLLVYAADSGECLQDHWSSGLCSVPCTLVCFVSSPEPSGSQGELIVYPCSVVRPSSVRRPSVRPSSTIFKDLLL